MIAVSLIGTANVTIQGLVDESKKAVDNPDDRPGLVDEFLVINIDSEGNPRINNEINITGKFESSSTLTEYKLYRNDNKIDDGTLSGSTASVKKKESPGQGVFRYKYEVHDSEGIRKNSSTLIIDNTSSTVPAGRIHEGGDNTQNLTWGTTGDVSIKLASGYGTPPFCIGNQCQESTGNKAPNKNTAKGPYLNRAEGDLNGTVKVTDKIGVNSNKKMCIGSGCGQTPGNANQTEVYGQDGTMDGPIVIRYDGRDARGIPTDSNGFCMGDYC
jgi:hypothetical protein